MLAVAWLCWPLGMMAGASLPDRGYVLGKIFGLWLIAALQWLFSALAFRNSAGLTLCLMAGVGALAWASFWNSAAPRRMIEKIKLTFWIEVLVLVVMVAGVYLRAMNPAITWNPEGWGAEKCTDFSWYNASLRAEHAPPYSPWLAGVKPNYYYLGHWLWATWFRVSGIAPGVDYNLALAALMGLTVAGVFSLGLALTGKARWALLAVVLLVVGGNLHPALQLGRGIMNGGWQGLAGAWNGFDWWGCSRSSTEEIFEFPAFSFLLGDLHAHVSALPLTLAALMALLHLERIWRLAGGNLRERSAQCAGAMLALAGISGFLMCANSWDAVSISILGALAAVIGAIAFAYRPPRDALVRLGWLALGFAAAVIIAQLTFCKGYITPVYSAPVSFDLLGRHFSIAWPLALTPRELRTTLADFLARYGLILLPLVLSTAPRLWKEWLCLEAPKRWFWVLAAALGWLSVTLWLGVAMPAFAALGAWLFWKAWARPGASLEEVFAAMLVAAGAVLAIGCELVYLDDIFAEANARINTVFKIHYFIWTAWTLAAVWAWTRLFENEKRKWPAALALGGVVALALLYPIAGLHIRSFARRLEVPNGLSIMQQRQFELDGVLAASLWGLDREEIEAIDWLRTQTPGQIFVCEAGGDAYSKAGRFATFAGTCAPLAWDQHVRAWQGPGVENMIVYRTEMLKALYSGANIPWALKELKRFNFRYLVVGDLERQTYGPLGAETLALEAIPMFKRGAVAIYAMDDLMDRFKEVSPAPER